MLKFNMKNRFLAVFFIELIFLIVFAGYYQSIMVDGFPVTLKSVQIDPDDLFRGSYLALNYEIEEYTPNKDEFDEEFGLDDQYSKGENVHVYLKKRGRYLVIKEVVGYYGDAEEVSAKNIFLKAKVRRISKGKLFLDYGLNRYYISRKKAEKYGFVSSTFDVKVKVGYDGKAVIEKVYYKGKKI